MKTIRMASTAKKSATKRAKRATLIAMAAIAGTSVSQMDAAARAAMADMKADMGENAFVVGYTWDPFDGMLA